MTASKQCKRCDFPDKTVNDSGQCLYCRNHIKRCIDNSGGLVTGEPADLSAMKEKFIIGAYWCGRCYHQSPANWDHIHHIALDEDGEMTSPCEICGAYNLLDLELIKGKPDGIEKMYSAMDSFVDLIFKAVRKVHYEEYRLDHPIPKTFSEPVNERPKLEGPERSCEKHTYGDRIV